VRFQRIAGLSAIGFVTVVVIANVARLAAGAPPAVNARPDEITAYYLDHTTTFRIASALPPLAWLLLAIFAAGAFAAIRRVERERGEAWSMVGVVGIVCLIVLFGGVVATEIALTAAATPTETTAGIWRLHHAYFQINSIGIAIAVTGFSVGGLRTATIRPWHGYLGLAAAALLVPAAMLAPLTSTGDHPALAAFGLCGFGLWLIFVTTYGVVLLRGRATASAPTTAIKRDPASPSMA
jgi:hypothetical protein